MKRSKPLAVTILPWLQANLGKYCTACLTGQDTRALIASVYLVEAYSNADWENGAKLLVAWRSTIETMQPSAQHLAFHSVAHVRDWGHRAEMWFAAGLPPIAVPPCKFEISHA